ncbi:hypothetical protein Mp_3g01720 [Marchantia polymorpha subsp. ruderalis]|uniref:Uncharacterized protein n=2 Tax=Marchantia polymorpha TaxID=3197 RepID=A0AAF6AWE7_MARPO|nr:hypothetical protein MARPO_0007s0164 [Marchantia polymorpha]BBN04081.1 hypothetical protein Mp_3g01720 [Marchantia polymorpha subsp. ruderalis]|eukprot:PTQ47768.1 hypothetical protein MARPO_0007s0164 [Marchantia polymorpha]
MMRFQSQLSGVRIADTVVSSSSWGCGIWSFLLAAARDSQYILSGESNLLTCLLYVHGHKLQSNQCCGGKKLEYVHVSLNECLRRASKSTLARSLLI